VLYVVDSPYRGRPDSFLWTLAGQEARALITRDIRSMLPSLSPRPPGVVLLRPPPEWRSAEIALWFQDAFQRLYQEDLVGHVVVVVPGQVRRRRLDDLP